MTSSVTDASTSRERRRFGSGRIWRSSEIRILAVALILCAYFETANHDFLLTGASLENLSQFIAPVALIAFGEIMLMIGGEIDLSAGMVFAFAPFIMHFATEAGLPVWAALLAGLLAASLVGLINGAVTVYLRIPSFVTTLGTLFFVNGFTLTISRGTPVSPPDNANFAAFMGAWGYSEIIWTVAIAAIMHVLLRHTRWGLHTIAGGANPLGASEAGIHVRRLKLGNFVIAAVLAGFTGILEGFRITSIDPQAGGNQIMFLAVAAAVIGGTPLAGGSGTIIGGLIGAAVLGILNDGFTLIGINAFTFNMILGAAILAAMIFNIHVVRLARKGDL
ncbi:simple sugar transport system permease protein [Paraburkholderia bryophila]|uniref:Simple sugar transport system permease protein n=1 Tax=Paraburkholderia bryophila TaxID=420952 RepID=A0A7Z0B5W6_9BURK|nr:simple sugar transport system permease protein [Paraburkholderia bryophila]